ncbi:MAG: gliding motility protein GldM [Flavobacteriales bacterium]
MASGKLSPRQKMINMMYLVLTALLALNISKDILNAFARVENGYATTVTALSAKNTQQLQDFADIAENVNAAKAPLQTAQQVTSQADKLIQSINELRTDLIAKTGGSEPSEELGIPVPKKMDDKEGAANMLLGKKQNRAGILKQKIETYRNYLLALPEVKENKEIFKNISTVFNTDDVKRKGSTPLDWEHHKFEHYPLIAILTFLRQIESDVVKVQSDVVGDLFASVGKTKFSFDQLKTMIVPESSSLMVGDRFKADVFVTAYDSRQSPVIKIKKGFKAGDQDFSGQEPIMVENGMGKLDFVVGSPGEHALGAEIMITTNEGESESYYTEVPLKYTVNSPTSVVSPTKMNVFYLGVKNPIAVSVPGVESKAVRVSLTGATQSSKGKGNYDVEVKPGAKKVLVSVTANGKRIGKAHEFRVKRIPNPVAKIANKNQGTISKGLFMQAQGIKAKLPDFPFDLKFKVTNFVFRIKDGEYVSPIGVKGARFTPAILEKVKRAKPDSDISFTNIKAKGPGKIGTKSCSPIVLTVQ